MATSSLTKRFLLTLLFSAALPLLGFGWFALTGVRERMEKRTGDVYLPQLASDAAANLAARLNLSPRELDAHLMAQSITDSEHEALLAAQRSAVVVEQSDLFAEA